jgi:hypothetical protein
MGLQDVVDEVDEANESGVVDRGRFSVDADHYDGGVGEREPQIAGCGKVACLYGTLNDWLKQILVERWMAGGHRSYADGIGVDAPNLMASFSEATGSNAPDSPQTNDSDAALHYLI